MDTVEVLPYDPAWQDWFLEIKSQIWSKLHDLIIDIVHVGSTSIVGMSAKPVIDIDILVNHWDDFPLIVERLETIGYIHIGNLGISEREAFKQDKPTKHAHNLYVCRVDSIAHRNHLLLKKHLKENPEDFKRYNDLKINLAKSVLNRNDYTKAKTELILEFLKSEGLDESELDIIRKENL